MYQCPLCKACEKSRQDLLRHCKQYHKKSAKSGICQLENCSKTYGDIYKYLTHLETVHIVNQANSNIQLPSHNKKHKIILDDFAIKKNSVQIHRYLTFLLIIMIVSTNIVKKS